ncbi:ribosome biogenesis GTP-binding protein YihA/YsxC [Candidatus Binatia bacterium]|nr:ribosome biogenesis GTP-binding protein YihA/YsxC [Candidatus Binatia bacterium]
MHTHNASFLAGSAEAARLPVWRYPEIAFAGRSNVGKSSLLNRLVGRRGLARVSKTPGRTQQINFFLVDDRVVFADLPGYGFARVPVAVRDSWKHLVEGYLSARRALRVVVVLVDLRRGLEADDEQLLDYLRAQRLPAVIVATKADKLALGHRRQRGRLLVAAVGESTPVIVCSAHSGDGLSVLWTTLLRYTGGD